MDYRDVAAALRAVASDQRAKSSAWFFKTGPGQYGEGDKFLGITVPEQRKIAKQYRDLSFVDIEKLIVSPWHEERLTSLFILVYRFQHSDGSLQEQIYDFYLSHTAYVNNWDLVDSSAPYIVGLYLCAHPNKLAILTDLARSKSLWDKRIAVMATFAFIQEGSAKEALSIINIVGADHHDLLQKACGWMLREIGKRVDQQILLDYLETNAHALPRTMLRYAIEHFSAGERAYFLSLKSRD